MTEVIEADVLRLFISQAAFLAGSKRRQMGFDKTLKKALLHNDVSDTLAMSWSDDSLQCLLAGVQTITGKKTHSDDLTVIKDKGLFLGEEGNIGSRTGIGIVLETGSGVDFILDCGGYVLLQSDGSTFLKGGPGGITLPDGMSVFLGDDELGELKRVGGDVSLENDAVIALDGGSAVELKQGGVTHLSASQGAVHIPLSLPVSLGGYGQLYAYDEDGYPVTVLETIGVEGTLVLGGYDAVSVFVEGGQVAQISKDPLDNSTVLDAVDQSLTLKGGGLNVRYSDDSLILQISSSSVVLQEGIWFGCDSLDAIADAVKVKSGKEFWLGAAYQTGYVPTPDGFIEIKDVNGDVLQIPVLKYVP